IRTALEDLRCLTNVFVCYSHEDLPHVLTLLGTIENRLNQRFIGFWRDGPSITGPRWPPDIQKGLDMAACAVAFFSPNLERHLHGETVPAGHKDVIRDMELPHLRRRSTEESLGCINVRLTEVCDECVAAIRDWIRLPGTGCVLGP